MDNGSRDFCAVPRVFSREIARVLHPVSSRWRTLAILIAYFDESGGHGGRGGEVFTLGGCVARSERWTRVERAWDRALGRRVFRMSEFENRKGAFETWPSSRRRIPLNAGLADSLAGNISVAIGHSLIFNDFAEVFAPGGGVSRPILLRHAYLFLLQSCLQDIMKFYGYKLSTSERVSVVCESVDGIEGTASEHFYKFKRVQGLDDLFLGITFLPKDSARALQAADMLAYENYKHVTNQIVREGERPIRKLFTALQNSQRLSAGYYDKAALTGVRTMILNEQVRLNRRGQQ